MPLEQIRNFLLIALAMVVFLIWQAWQTDYGPKTPTAAPTATSSTPSLPANTVKGGDQSAVTHADVPAAPAQEKQQQAAAPKTALEPVELLKVRTDQFDVGINLHGGGLEVLKLLAFDESAQQPDIPFTLLNNQPPNIFMVQSGLLGPPQAPNHRVTFESRQREYRMQDGEKQLVVPLFWQSDDGVEVTKRYIFTRGSYVIGLEYLIKNNSSKAWDTRLYGQFQRAEVAAKGGLFRTYTYTGGVISQPEKPYSKIKFGDMGDANLDVSYKGGWVAMIQHYFAGALVPDPQAENYYYSKALGNSLFVLGVMTPAQAIQPGQSGTLSLKIYTGPKDQDRMKALAPYLERTVDYGWLWFIAEPIFWSLRAIHGVLGNWGFAIILLTVIIKLLFFKLSATSYKSMANMRKLQPRIAQLRDRYKGDKSRMNQAMMELYKTEKINPLGGCLPIVVQIPVFISLYWVLLESVELRQSPFIFWIHDLSGHDPYFVLPLLMGISMFAQQRLNPTPPDPMQAKIMMALPIVFTFLFLFFPSGLVLYWFVNNLLSITQQWVITRKIVGTT